MALDLPEALVKDPTGKHLINKFCRPPFADPTDWEEDWEDFKYYSRQDVIAEMAISRRLSAHPWTKEEHELWIWDQEVNKRGLPIDAEFARRAVELSDQYAGELMEKLKILTGLENPASQQQFLKWMQDQGLPAKNVQAATLERLVSNG